MVDTRYLCVDDGRPASMVLAFRQHFINIANVPTLFVGSVMVKKILSFFLC